MPRIRSIKPEFCQSETIGKLSRDARLLFIQLWTVVDDLGRARASSRALASLLYPFDDDAKDLIGGWLEELGAHGCIHQYMVDENHYLTIPNWLKHQKIDHPGKSHIPEPSRALASPRETLATDLGPRTLDLGSRKEEDTDASASVESPEKENKGRKKEPYAFESGVIRLTLVDLERWKTAFPNLSVEGELVGLSPWAAEQGDRWFHAVSAALAKRNREMHTKRLNGHAAPDSVTDFQARWKVNAEKQLKEREEWEAVRARKSN